MSDLFLRLTGVLFLIGLMGWPTILWAHGVVGKRLFVEPMATEDANVFSEYDVLVPSYIKEEEGEELELGTSLTLQLTENLGLEIEGEWVNLDPEEGSSESGLANPEAVLKYAAYVNPEHEWIATVAVGAEFPYGSEDVGAEGIWGLETGFFYGKGFGDLPEGLAFLRPLMVQGDMVLHTPLKTRPADESFSTLSYDFAVYYSIPYLQQFVKDVGIPWPFSRLFPMVELNYERILNGSDQGTIDGVARPGVMWVGKSVQFGLAAVVPVTGHPKEDGERGVIGIVSLYLDDMFPSVFKKPLLGE